MNKRLVGLVISLGLAGGTSLWDHHSLAAEYDQKKQVTLTGTLRAVSDSVPRLSMVPLTRVWM